MFPCSFVQFSGLPIPLSARCVVASGGVPDEPRGRMGCFAIVVGLCCLGCCNHISPYFRVSVSICVSVPIRAHPCSSVGDIFSLRSLSPLLNLIVSIVDNSSFGKRMLARAVVVDFFCCFCCWKFIFLARNLNKNPLRSSYPSILSRYIPDTYPIHTRYIRISYEYPTYTP